MIKEYNHSAFENWHNLIAHGLVFLSMVVGLFIFGMVFASDHDKQVYALSDQAGILSAQIYSVYSEHQKNYLAQQQQLLRPPLVYDRPLVRFNYPDDQLKEPINKLLNRMEELSR